MSFWTAGLATLALALAAAPRTADAAGPIPGITSSSKFLIYYGNDFGTTNLQLMSEFDVVVIDPNVSNCTPAVVATLQDAGVLVFAYISIGEDAGSTPIIGNADGPVFHDGTTIRQVDNLDPSQKIASFYVDQQWDPNLNTYVTDKSPDTNATFHGYFVHPNGDWRWVINTQRIGGSTGLPTRTQFAGLQQIAGARTSDTDTDRTHDFGFDGFFLDTLDTAGPYENVYGYYPWAAQEMSNTVQFICNTYSNKYVLANRGLFFYHPGLVNSTFNVRPYDYTIRPYVHGILFESYYLDSNASDPNESNNHPDNKHNYAQKVMAEANRSDGFTVFCVDYQMNRGEPYYANAVAETIVANGWTEYLSPNGFLDTVGTYVADLLDTNPPADNAAPVWDSTGSPPFTTTDVTDRVGVQQVVAGANDDEVIVRWDIARDQSPPVKYNIYRSTDPSFSNPVKYAGVAFSTGAGWATDPQTAYANEYTIDNLPPGTHYFRVRAEDSDATPMEDTNTATLSITIGSAMATVSNPLSSGALTTDGSLSDWSGLDSFGQDPDDIAVGTQQADWREAWMAHDPTYFHLAYLNDTNISINWGFTVYLDTDSNAGTGFTGPSGNYPIGADYMIQGYSLYSYSGSGTDWSWSFIAECGRAWSGTTGEQFFPRSWIGSPSALNLFFVGDNTAFGNPGIDDYPDNAMSSPIGFFRYETN